MILKYLLRKESIETRNPGLDIMRAIAIILVLISHGRKFFENTAYSGKIYLIQFWGFFGVEVFFVLSGFLIGGIIIDSFRKEQTSFHTVLVFWKKRWYRTLPDYYFILFVFFIISLTGLGYTDFDWKSLLFLQNFFTRIGTFFPVSWSLAIEEWSYLTFPLVLFLFLKTTKGKHKFKFAFLISALVIILTALLIRFYYFETGTSAYDIGKTLVCRIDSIIYGALFAFFIKFYEQEFRVYKNIYLVAGLVIVVAVTYELYTNVAYGHYSVYNSVFLFSILSISFWLCIPWLFYLKINHSGVIIRIITLISLTSYSIYLTHYPLILTPIRYLFSDGRIITAAAGFLIYLILTLFVSYILYQFIEKPFLNLRKTIR